MTKLASATSVLSIRVSAGERAILEAAAEQARTSLSDFMRRKALEAAEIDVLNCSVVTIPAKDWEAFEAWINCPAESIPALRELARKVPGWVLQLGGVDSTGSTGCHRRQSFCGYCTDSVIAVNLHDSQM